LARYYPLCLKLEGKPCLVVGGGTVALRKAKDLLEAGAKVRAVAPDFVAGFRKTCGVELVRRAYRASDLRGCALVIAATNDENLNRRVSSDARREKALANVVDAPELCDFIVPSTLRRGDMTISVSTGGASPSLARKIRLELEKRYPAAYGLYVRFLGEMRRMVKENIAPSKRRVILERMVEKTWPALVDKGVAAARKIMMKILEAEKK